MTQIAGWPRRICALASVVLLALGGVATFTTTNGIGTGALVVVGGVAGVTALLGRVPRMRVGDWELDSELVRGVHDTAVEATVANMAEAIGANKDPEDVVDAGLRASWADSEDDWITDEELLEQFDSRQPGSVYTIQKGPDGGDWGVIYNSLTGRPKKVRRLPAVTLRELLFDEERRAASPDYHRALGEMLKMHRDS